MMNKTKIRQRQSQSYMIETKTPTKKAGKASRLSMRGSIQGCVMPIMFWINKFKMLLVAGSMTVMCVKSMCASAAVTWVDSKAGRVHLKMEDGSVFDLKLLPEAKGVFYSPDKHAVEGRYYLSLFQVLPSSPRKPEGLCGAGSEVFLVVFKETNAGFSEQLRVLVSSCLRSISMASQNTGKLNQDTDFSSVQWDAKGFFIDWFYNSDATGQPLSSTHYRLYNNGFSTVDVVSKESSSE